MAEPLYDTASLALRLSCGIGLAYRLVRNGQIKSARVGNRWRITEESVREFLQGGGNEDEHTGKPEMQHAA